MSISENRLKFLDQAATLMECERALLKLNAPLEIIRHVHTARKMLEETIKE